MKPAYLFVVAALAAVGALLFFSLDSDSDRRGGRGGSLREERGQGDGAREEESQSGDQAGAQTTARPEGAFGATIVVKSEGAAVAGADVLLTGPRVWSGATDEGGRAAAGWLRPGLYAVVASRGGLTAACTFSITDGDREIELSLAAGVPVRGTVFASDGTPIMGARVTAEPKSERISANPRWNISWIAAGAHPPVFAETTTDDTGTYLLLLPGAGEYAVHVEAQGFSSDLEPDRLYDKPVDGLDFHLQPGAAVDGTVVDANGDPVAGAFVLATASRRGRTIRGLAETGADGTFSLTAALEGWSHLTVRKRGYTTNTVGTVHPPVHGLKLTLERGATARLRLVIKGTGGTPAVGVEAQLYTMGGALTGTSNADGVIEIENSTASGGDSGMSWRMLSVAGGGFVPLQKSLGPAPVIDGVIDLGEIELERGATVRGRVTDSSTGNAIEGATVRYFSMTAMRFASIPITTATTDAEGRYELIGVPPDTVEILASHDDFDSAVDRQALFMRAREKSAWLLAPGQLLLQRDLELFPAITLRGTVLDPDGQPAAGARVTGPWKGGLPGGGGGAASDTTNGEGQFELTGYEKGRKIQIRAEHRDFAGAATVTVTVGSGEEPVLELAMPVTLKGIVVDGKGEPVAGVGVRASKPHKPGIPSRQDALTGVTDKAGRFVIRNLPPGERQVRFDHARFLVSRADVSIPGGKDEFDMGTTRLDTGIGIAGRVVDKEGAGIAGVMVSLSFQSEKRMRRDPNATERSNASVSTDEQGNFAASGLKEGSYRITARVPGRYTTSPVATTGDTEVQVLAKEPARIRGHVVSGAGPVKGAWIRATQPGNNPSNPRWIATSSSGEDGAFDLGPVPPEETFGLVVTHNDFKKLEHKGVTATTAPAELALDAGASIVGKVVDESGEPVKAANLSINAVGEATSARGKWANTKEDGSFRVGGLDAGRYTVRVTWTREGHVTGDPIETEAGGEEVTLTVKKGRTIKGKLKVANPDTLGQVRITATDKDGNTKATAWVWGPTSTEFELRALDAGTYTIKVVRGWGDDAKTLTAVPGVESGETELEIAVDG
ncbi:MAG: carboxypeptidase regulatory-like domain-containing protein [Planctomycetota bacterium]|jgi:protocatechuate 3,4-dioxygenase beta subunit